MSSRGGLVSGAKLCLLPLLLGVTGTTGGAPAGPWARLNGEWRGRGVFLGARATADLRWESVLDGRFHRQTHRIVMRRFEGDQVYESHAYYATAPGNRTTGTWFDIQGTTFVFQVELHEDAVATRWGPRPPSGLVGRTVYRALGDTLMVVDSTLADGRWREIGRMSYTRVGSP